MKDPLHAEIVSQLRRRIKPGMAGVELEKEAAQAIEELEEHSERLYQEIIELRRMISSREITEHKFADDNYWHDLESGFGATPSEWSMVSEELNGAPLPEPINEAIYALRDGRAVVIRHEHE